MRYRSFLAASAATVLAAVTTLVSASTSSATPTEASSQSAPAGSFAYSGQKARDFTLPTDVQRISQSTLADGSTQTRYQQMVGRASVFGGQITVIADAAGTVESVIGAYFPGLEPRNQLNVSRQEARQKVEAQIGSRGQWSQELRIDPRTSRLFHAVESIRPASRPVRWIDAGNGRTVKALNALAHGEGIGVKGDRKTIDTTRRADNNLYELRSAELAANGKARYVTYDWQNAQANPIVMTDDNDIWDTNLAWRSPSQNAGVDAHYYAGVVDDFYGETFGRNSIDDKGMAIISVVHYGTRYCNAFWNGSYMTYGDGDGDTCISLSGGLDVDGHELTHGVTEHTSNLIYENESGALNEAFSDMMANTIEFYAERKGLDPAVEPDWYIGEDIILDGTAEPGFRNMADPQEDGDPSHYSQRYTGTSDGGGVHTNSGIANHAYYLTAEGGQNASCRATADHGVLLTGPDCAVTVPALGLARAADIYYKGFTSLPEYANMCDARNATMAAAKKDSKSLGLAWDAVGVHNRCTPGTPPPPPCTGSANATLPIESPHPYGNNGDCTWTYDNQSAGFSFHFTLLDMEKDYDYVYVRDANGTVLASYTGTAMREFDSPCISTSTGSVRMVTDPAVTGQGFTISAVNPC